MKAYGKLIARSLVIGNIVLTLVLALLFSTKGSDLRGTWDGPTVATIALTAATIVLAAVALCVALLAVWGYSSMREHAGNVAGLAAKAAAESLMTAALREWGITDANANSGEDIAAAYRTEEPDAEH
jgi:hypothetical protein